MLSFKIWQCLSRRYNQLWNVLSFLVKTGSNWDAMSPWHNVLEGMQLAAGPEWSWEESAKPAWSSSLDRWETGLNVGCPSCLAAFSRSMKSQTQNFSLLSAVRSWSWIRSLIYITAALLCPLFLCLVCCRSDCLSMCENGYRVQSCCCDGILENEIHGFYGVGLVKFGDSCKTACAVFSTCTHLLQCVLKILYIPQQWSLILVTLSLKRLREKKK